MQEFDIKELLVRDDLYYRGYNSRYGVFDNRENYSFTWITDDPEYALEYARGSGNVAIVKMNDADIGCILDLDENIDHYDPSEDNMEELYGKGLNGFGFYANEDSSYCVCVNKKVLEIICCVPATIFIEQVKNTGKWI